MNYGAMLISEKLDNVAEVCYAGRAEMNRTRQKHFALWTRSKVDPEDQHELDERSWYIAMIGSKPYVVGGDRINGRTMTRRLHRVIMDAPPGMQVDHINGDTLDNRRCNLRLCTNAENQRNRHVVRGRSKFKGVCWHKRRYKWQARIEVDEKRIHIGYFDNELGAAFAYDVAARILFGEFARLNFQDD